MIQPLADWGDGLNAYCTRDRIPIEQPRIWCVSNSCKSQNASNEFICSRWQALLRDGFRCLASAAWDLPSFVKFSELAQLADLDTSTQLKHTECCHIFPEYIDTTQDDECENEAYGMGQVFDQNFGYGQDGDQDGRFVQDVSRFPCLNSRSC